MEASGEASVRLAKAAEQVSRELNAEIAVAPPPPLLSSVAHSVSIPVLAQHVDLDEAGSSTGAVVAEQVKAAGCGGSLVNHSEKRLPMDSIRQVIQRLTTLDMISVVCARSPEEISAIASFNPSFAAVEPPELIGSGRAVSKVRPEAVVQSVEAARRTNPSVKVICGAGIVSGEDVRAALRLGAEGVLVASGVVKAEDWRGAIRGLAEPLAKGSKLSSKY